MDQGMLYRGIPMEQYLRQQVEAALSVERQRHVYGVVEMAAALGAEHGLPIWWGRWAGYLHDLMREWPPERLLKAADDFGIVISDLERAEPVLLHGPVVAAWARCQLGIDDEAFLAALAYHATGRAGMGLGEAVLLVADKAEPTRDYPGVDAIRYWSQRDLWQACRLTIDASLRYCLQRGRPIHPMSISARNWLLLQQRVTRYPDVGML